MYFISAYSRCSFSFGTHQAGFSGGEYIHKILLFDTTSPLCASCSNQKLVIDGLSHVTPSCHVTHDKKTFLSCNNSAQRLHYHAYRMWHKWQNSQHPTHTSFQKTNKHNSSQPAVYAGNMFKEHHLHKFLWLIGLVVSCFYNIRSFLLFIKTIHSACIYVCLNVLIGWFEFYQYAVFRCIRHYKW